MSQQTMTRRTGTSSATTQPAPRRRVNITLWVLQSLAAAMFALGGINKLAGEAQTVAGFNEIGLGDWFRYLIGALELAGAIGLLIPVLSGLAGLAFVGLMIGAVITQAVVFDGEMVALPAVVLVVVAIIAWGRRRRNADLVALLKNPRRARAR
jgi:uncharacterized membrane protein YphA (DoxX/SURF4 family)